jgi:hypothetical protein
MALNPVAEVRAQLDRIDAIVLPVFSDTGDRRLLEVFEAIGAAGFWLDQLAEGGDR